MAFVLKQSDTYSWPVKVELPTDGGRVDVQTFDATFKRLSQTRVNELIEGAQAGAITDRQVCVEIVTGWAGVLDDGADVPFSASALASLLDVPGVERGILQAWFESLAGAKRKN